MGERILVRVPERVEVDYVVAAPEREVADPEGEVLDRLTLPEEPPPLEVRVTEIGPEHPEISRMVSVFCCPECSPESGPLLAALLEGAGSHLMVTCTAPPGWPPVHLWAAGQAACVLAELTGGIPLDTLAPKRLPAGWRPEPAGSPDGLVLAEWIQLHATPGPGGYLLGSSGLVRFGLPEVAVTGLGPEHLPGWGRLLNGLADRLARWLFTDVGRHPERSTRTMPADVRVTTADAARAEGRLPPPVVEEVHVRLRHDERGRLVVLPPGGAERRGRQWHDLVHRAMRR